jgi:hypothetical protein
MCRKLIYVAGFVLMLTFGSISRGDVDLTKGLVAWWTFDEGAGTIAHDGSGNNNHATLLGNAAWTTDAAPGKGGSAISLNGTSAYLRVEHSPSLNLPNALTFEMWVYGGGAPAKQIISKGNTGDGTAWWQPLGVRIDNDPPYYRQINWRNRVGETVNALNSNTAIPPAEWTHIAVTFDVNAPGNNQKIYINGKLDAESRSTTPLVTNNGPIFIGADTYTAGGRWFWQGMMDEGSVYNRALNAVEIKTIAGVTAATDPTPRNGSTISTTNVLLEWYQGSDVANTNGHHVYFGDKFADVNAAAANTDRGFVTDPNYYVANLVTGTTYYWRVDEVNNVDANIWTGDVWSFKVAPGKATVPSPSDGAVYVGRNRVLSWAPGTGAVSHHIYFGTDQTKVVVGAAETDKGSRIDPNYTPGTLNHDTTYYWRVDEFDGSTTHAGYIWSFVTTASGDPNLVGWWQFEGNYLDISGNENHGRPINDANIATTTTRPYSGQTSVVNLNGTDECVYIPYSASLDIYNKVTISMWAYTTTTGATTDRFISKGGWNNVCYTFRLEGAGRTIQWRGTSAGNFLRSTGSFPTNQWVHVAITFDVNDPGNNQKIYINGQLDAENRSTNPLTRNLYYVAIGGRDGAAHMWAGMIDDVRIYNRALTASEVQIVMTGDPNVARDPMPADRSTPDQEHATPLSWKAGANAARHDVYFGTSAGAVQNAAPSDPMGVYWGRQSAATYAPPVAVQWGQTYYWRIDEVNEIHPDSPWKGRVWSFTVADYLIVDDFEGYDDFCNRIFYAWKEGWGYSAEPACGVTAYNGNGTGSTVGNLEPPFAERTIIHSGIQAMPFGYDNSAGTNYSESGRTFATAQDWTINGVKALTLWFRGNPAAFLASAGKYTMSASGADIWGTADQFRFAFKQLSGNGSIVARVLSVQNTDPWAKAGVMIRESLDPGSQFANLLIAPGNGCRFQTRPTTGGTCLSDSAVTTLAGIRAPHWIKLERVGDTFTAYDSNDPAAEGWHPLVWGPQTIPMQANIYVGLSLTSHNVNATCVAEFSDVSTTGNVAGAEWQVQAIGASMPTNDPDRVYVGVQDSDDKVKAVSYADPAATLLPTWQEWNIDLKELSNAGINLKSIKKLYLGVGNRDNPTVGGTGSLYFDDIRLYKPRCVASLLRPAADFSGNCIVDYADIEIMASEWLDTGDTLTADLDANKKVDLKDYAKLADDWLAQLSWPQP